MVPEISMASYQVEAVSGKGLGILACSKLARGSLIISEPPLFTIPRSGINPSKISGIIAEKLKSLNKDQQREFFSLCNTHKDLDAFHGIVKTNAMPLGRNADMGGIFPICSRFNHSCCSNAAYSWCGKLGRERVFAIKDIGEGEEISVSYLSEDDWAKPREQRQLHLMNNFGFRCCYRTCSLPAKEVCESDKRRETLSQLENAIGDGMLIVSNPNRALKFCAETLQLLAEEGSTDMSVEAAYYDAFQICVAHGDHARASAMAKLAVRHMAECQGSDADRIEEIRSFIQAPEKHRLAGTSSKWSLKRKFTRTPESEGFEKWLWSRCG